MIINHSLGAMNAHRQMGANQNDMSNSMKETIRKQSSLCKI